MFPAALAIVTVLAELSIFLMMYCLPVTPTAVGSVTVNAPLVLSARMTESAAVRVLD